MMDSADFVDTAETPLESHGARSLPFGPGFAIAAGALITGFGFVSRLRREPGGAVRPQGLPRDQRWLIPPTLVFMILVGSA